MRQSSKWAARSGVLAISLGLAGLITATGVAAKPFKWSSASDIPTLDIHSQNNAWAQISLHNSLDWTLIKVN